MKLMTLAGTAAVILSFASLALADTPLQGRDINGKPVAQLDQSAVFEYDTDQNITWLRDWGASGSLTWTAAGNWAAGLTSATVGTFVGGWTIPTKDNFLNLWTLQNLYGFQNVQTGGNGYWTSEMDPQQEGYAWVFLANGALGTAPEAFPAYAVAVKSGDIASAVPEPAGPLMMIAGLCAIWKASRRKRPQHVKT